MGPNLNYFPSTTSNNCCYYRCLVVTFVVILVSGALTFATLERDLEVQTRFKLSETKREFSKKFNISGLIMEFFVFLL